MLPDKLTQSLDDLDTAFAEQEKYWNEQFSRAWDKQLASLQQAISAASASVPMANREALQERLSQLCALYLSMDDEHRAELRQAVALRKHLLHAFREHALWAAQKIQSPADVEWLRAGLAAASIEDGRIDFRDSLMNLGELYVAAEKHGITPGAYFTEMAALSSSEPTPFKSWSCTRHVLFNFEQTAFFHADVKIRLT